MNKKLIKEILELANGKMTTITLDDDFFGFVYYEWENYSYELKENELVLTSKKDIFDTRTYNYKNIRDILVETDNEHILEIIKKAKTMSTILPFIWNIPLADNENSDIKEALELKEKEMFESRIDYYTEQTKKELQYKINSMGLNSNAEKLFNDLVVNILGKDKIETYIDFQTFITEMRNADKLIKKIIKNKEKEVF